MSERSGFPPLGKILRAADLISSAQLEVALKDQQFYQLRIGEIIALHGWLQQETADFFAEDWLRLTISETHHPLGYYLRRAALLNEEQIQTVLQEQKQMGVRFGSVAVIRGWLKQKTLDYFLENLAPQSQAISAFQGKQNLKQEIEEYPSDQEVYSSLYISESVITYPETCQAEYQGSPRTPDGSKGQSKPIIQVQGKKKISKAMVAQQLMDGDDFDLSAALNLDLEAFGLIASSEGSISW